MLFTTVVRRSALFSSTAALCVVLVSALPALAQGVGPHVSVATGTVSGEHGGSNQAFPLGTGAPIGTGDFLSTDASGRAEIALDDASLVRLGPGAQVRFVGLSAGDRRVQLAEGVAGVRLFSRDDLGLNVDTPSVSVRPLDAGSYRVSVSADGFTQVTVRGGRVEVETPSGAQTIGAGTMLVAHGPASNPEITTTTPIAYDDFDRFNDDCDRRYGTALAQAPAPPVFSNPGGQPDPNAAWPGVPPGANAPLSQPVDGGPYQPSASTQGVPAPSGNGQVIVNNGSGTINVYNNTPQNGGGQSYPQSAPPSYQSAPSPSYGQSGPYDSGPPPSAVALPSYAVPAGPPVYYQSYAVPVAPRPVLSISVGWSQFSAQRGGWYGPGYRGAPAPGYANGSGWRVRAGYSNGSWSAHGAIRTAGPSGSSGWSASAGWSASRGNGYPMRQPVAGGTYRATAGASRSGGYAHASYGAVAHR